MTSDLDILKSFWHAARGDPAKADQVSFVGLGELPSTFAVTSFASATVGTCGLALASLIGATGFDDSHETPVMIDRRLTSFWFHDSLRPVGWKTPPNSDPTAGDYLARDGWIRLHTNAPHHRQAALAVLSADNNRESVAKAVATWHCDELESAVVANKGCAATMRTWEAWQQHPQGQAVMAEPLIAWENGDRAHQPTWAFNRARPLEGLKVLDLTRVLAGPTCTRMLGAFGADVLRVDPPCWTEPGNEPEMTVGKRCARVDLRGPGNLDLFKALIQQADVMVHGYRSDALEAMGLGATERQKLRPGLIDVSLDAYGHTGPWRHRRGFDSLVQMSMGIAEMGQRVQQKDRPTPLPVQALDFGTGYLLAAAALRGLETRVRTGLGSIARLSLARTGIEVMRLQHPHNHVCETLRPESAEDIDQRPEQTYWGLAHRLKPPLSVFGVEQYWRSAATPLGSNPCGW